jgi:hypothetical protein
MTVTESHAIAATVTERIRELWIMRSWWRHTRWAAEWSPRRQEYEVELRALVRLARKARRLAREAGERRDPMTAAKARDYHAWQAAGPVTEPELIAGYGGWPEGDSDVAVGIYTGSGR